MHTTNDFDQHNQERLIGTEAQRTEDDMYVISMYRLTAV